MNEIKLSEKLENIDYMETKIKETDGVYLITNRVNFFQEKNDIRHEFYKYHDENKYPSYDKKIFCFRQMIKKVKQIENKLEQYENKLLNRENDNKIMASQVKRIKELEKENKELNKQLDEIYGIFNFNPIITEINHETLIQNLTDMLNYAEIYIEDRQKNKINKEKADKYEILINKFPEEIKNKVNFIQSIKILHNIPEKEFARLEFYFDEKQESYNFPFDYDLLEKLWKLRLKEKFNIKYNDGKYTNTYGIHVESDDFFEFLSQCNRNSKIDIRKCMFSISRNNKKFTKYEIDKLINQRGKDAKN